jgi:TonB family protein
MAPAYRTYRVALAGLTLLVTGCDAVGSTLARFRGPDTSPPDSLPQLLNDSLPFKYPIGLYLQLVDDSVTLRLHVDTYGRPVAESTKVEVPAGHMAFDSSALEGSKELLFRPAIRKGKPVPYTVLFPIQFKIPTVPLSLPDTTHTKVQGR